MRFIKYRYWLLLGALVLTALSSVSLSSLTPWNKESVRLTNISHELGNCFIAPLPHDKWSSVKQPSTAELYENGRPLIPGNALHDDIRKYGHGRHSFWMNQIYFSTLDNTDPQTNGKVYTTVGPSRDFRITFRIISRVLPIIAIFVWIMVMYSFIGSLSRAHQMNESLAIPRKMAEGKAVFRLLMALFPSAVVLLLLPPTWNSIDSMALLVRPLDMIPHFAPLTPLFVFTVVKIFGKTDAAIYTIILIQHAFFSAGLYYLASAFGKLWQTFVVIVSSSLCLGILFVMNGLWSEALFVAWHLFLIGAFVRLALYNDCSFRTLLVFFSAIFLMIMTRYIGAVFALILPLYFIISLPWLKKNFFLKLASSLILVFAVVIVPKLTASTITTFIGNPNENITGRAGIGRIRELPWDTMQDSERQAVISGWFREVNDPILRATFMMAIDPKIALWTGAYKELEGMIRKHNEDHPDTYISKTPDDYLNAAFLIYLTTPNKFTLMTILRDIKYQMTKTNFYNYFYQSIELVDACSKGDGDANEMRGLASASSEKKDVYLTLANSWWVRAADSVPPWLLFTVIFSLSLLFVILSIPRVAIFAWTILITAILYMIALNVITFNLPRYFLPSLLMVYSGIGIMLASLGFLDRRREEKNTVLHETKGTPRSVLEDDFR